MKHLTESPLTILKDVITTIPDYHSPLLAILPDLLDGQEEDILGKRFSKMEQLAYGELVHLSRDYFYVFVRIMANFVLEIPYKDGRHIRLICSKLQDLYEGKERRLMVFLPPRSMKSKLCSVLYPAWCFGRSPNWQIIQVGHSTTFVQNKFSAKVRDLTQTPEFREIFPEFRLSKSTQGKEQWETKHGGSYLAAGAGKSIAGNGADIAICDDVLSEQSAVSDTDRVKINEWYYPGLESRLQPEGRELVINTRWHQDDLSGFLLAKEEEQEKMIKSGELDEMDEAFHDPWTIISIPAIVDHDSSELLGIPVGESYWPEHWNKKLLMRRKGRYTPQKWAALYMQNPIPEEGNIIKPEWCQKWTGQEPPVEYTLLSIDTAMSEKQSADYSAITYWGVFFTSESGMDGEEYVLPNIIMLEAYRGRWGFHELCDMVCEMNLKHKPDSIIVEEKVTGIALLRELGRRGLPVLPYNPGTTDKQARLHTCTPTFYNKQVYFVDGPSTTDVLAELLAFPHAKHDDFVDTTSQAIIFMREASKLWLANDGEGWGDDEEDEEYYSPEPKTYWDTVVPSSS